MQPGEKRDFFAPFLQIEPFFEGEKPYCSLSPRFKSFLFALGWVHSFQLQGLKVLKVKKGMKYEKKISKSSLASLVFRTSYMYKI